MAFLFETTLLKAKSRNISWPYCFLNSVVKEKYLESISLFTILLPLSQSFTLFHLSLVWILLSGLVPGTLILQSLIINKESKIQPVHKDGFRVIAGDCCNVGIQLAGCVQSVEDLHLNCIKSVQINIKCAHIMYYL